MSLPKIKDIELPLLIELNKAGGKEDWDKLASAFATYFPEIAEIDLLK